MASIRLRRELRSLPALYVTVTVLGSATVGSACASGQPRVEYEWVHRTTPSRSFAGDDQECRLISQALAARNYSTSLILRVIGERVEWKTCMVGRGWSEVPVGDGQSAQGARDVALPAPEARWALLTMSGDARLYVDSTRVERPTASTVALWLNLQFSRIQEIGGARLWKVVSRREYDCEHRRARNTTVAVYAGPDSPPIAEPPNDVWSDVLPESLDEMVVRAMCR